MGAVAIVLIWMFSGFFVLLIAAVILKISRRTKKKQ